LKLYLKGERCYSDKCSVERRSYPPGQHGQGRVKFSEYGQQLREKQKVKRIYGMLEKQFRNAFYEASRKKGVTGENMILLLERRLDNMVYRMGFAASRNQARMWITHCNFLVNGKKVNIPSYKVRVGDKITPSELGKKIAAIRENLAATQRRAFPRWVSVDVERMEGVVNEFPKREDITMPMEEHLIVELYSK
jgi:small subunit ribosomal protein S4